MSRALEALMGPTKRGEMTQEIRKGVFDAQGGICADCGDQLSKYQVDHRIPLCFGGADDVSNFAAVCVSCHTSKSYNENLSNLEDGNPLLSRFNRETHKLYACSPKPAQLVANLHEAQSGHTLQADVIRCRYTQFIENLHDLPVFCALDEIVPATLGNLGDYNYIHRTRDLRCPLNLLPYGGPGFYFRAETEWMIDVGIVKLDEILYTFTASARFPAKYLATRLEKLETLWKSAQESSGSALDAKFALNSMFGFGASSTDTLTI